MLVFGHFIHFERLPLYEFFLYGIIFPILRHLGVYFLVNTNIFVKNQKLCLPFWHFFSAFLSWNTENVFILQFLVSKAILVKFCKIEKFLTLVKFWLYDNWPFATLELPESKI